MDDHDRRACAGAPRARRLITAIPCTLTLLLAVAGCPSPNTYTTARTLPRHARQLVVAADAVRSVAGSGTDDVIPAVMLRWGVTDRVEVGVGGRGLSAALDTKLQLHRGTIDLALDPGLQGNLIPVPAISLFPELGPSRDRVGLFGVGCAHLPVLVDFNISREVSIVSSLGASYRFGSGDSLSLWSGEAGLALNLRIGRHVAIEPQVTVIQSSDHERYVLGSLALSFGAQPAVD